MLEAFLKPRIRRWLVRNRVLGEEVCHESSCVIVSSCFTQRSFGFHDKPA
jgi:hypothetical protein